MRSRAGFFLFMEKTRLKHEKKPTPHQRHGIIISETDRLTKRGKSSTYAGDLVERDIVGNVGGHEGKGSVGRAELKDFGQSNGNRGTGGNGSSRGGGNQGARVGTPDESGPQDEGDAGQMDADIPDVVVMGTVLEQLVLEVKDLGLGHYDGKWEKKGWRWRWRQRDKEKRRKEKKREKKRTTVGET